MIPMRPYDGCFPHKNRVPLHSSLGIGPMTAKYIAKATQDWLDENVDSIQSLIAFQTKLEGTYVTDTAPTSTITVPISDFSYNDILFVDVNGLDLVEGVDYEVFSNSIVLTNPIEQVGVSVHFTVLRFITVNVDQYSAFMNYDALGNRPSIESHILTGNMTLDFLNIAARDEAVKSIERTGTTFTVTRTDGTTFTFDQQDNDTWVANSDDDAGYVAAGSGHANKVWKTDSDGVPSWRDDDDTTYGLATTTTPGLMSAADKTAIASLVTGAVVGVKGDAENDYRTGNVNITPANVGAASSGHLHVLTESLLEFVTVSATTTINISSLDYDDTEDVISVYINGMRLTQLEYSISGNVLTLANTIAAGNDITVSVIKVGQVTETT